MKEQEKILSGESRGKIVLPGPLPPSGASFSLDEVMSPIVKNYLSRTAEEKKRFPPIPWPGMSGKKKLAVCGLASTTRHQAPFKDPEWDIWTMHMGGQILERVDLLFEPHDPLFAGVETGPTGMNQQVWEPEYTAFLKNVKIPVMMQDHYAEFPTSIKFPFMELVEQFGRFFSTSVAWMMAMGIRNGYERIDLYGVEMEHGTEYHNQGKSVVYFIGLAEGRGIEIGMPRACQLMKNRYLYGLETKQQDEVIQRIDRHESELQGHRQQAEAQLSQIQAEHQRILGRLDECNAIRLRILLGD
jgi:hypothetical protein